MGNSPAKILSPPPKDKETYILMFPRDKDYAVYDSATAEFEDIVKDKKKKKMTKEMFMNSQKERFAGMDENLMKAIWNAFDSDGNGVMDIDEFRLYRAVNAVGSRRQRAVALFAVTDTSNDRALQKKEVVTMMTYAFLFNKKSKMDAPPTEILKLDDEEKAQVAREADAFMERHDKDKNKSIELEEFLKGWDDQAFADFNFFDDKNAPSTTPVDLTELKKKDEEKLHAKENKKKEAAARKQEEKERKQMEKEEKEREKKAKQHQKDAHKDPLTE